MGDKDNSWKDVNAQIVKGFKDGESMAELADRFGLPWYCINRAIREQMIKESP